MSDKVSDRLFIAVLTLIIPIPFLSIFRGVGAEDYWVFFILVPILGFTLGGGTAFISAVIAADLSQSASNKKTESKSTIAGIIDGSGGLGASFGQLIVRFI